MEILTIIYFQLPSKTLNFFGPQSKLLPLPAAYGTHTTRIRDDRPTGYRRDTVIES